MLVCNSDEKTWDNVPEGERIVCNEGIALSDQEGAVSSAGLFTVLLDQPLGHLPAFLHATVEPRLRAVKVLILKRHKNKNFSSTFLNYCKTSVNNLEESGLGLQHFSLMTSESQKLYLSHL